MRKGLIFLPRRVEIVSLLILRLALRKVDMCPFCFGSLGLVVTGIVSTGGLAALAVKVRGKIRGPKNAWRLRGTSASGKRRGAQAR